MRRKELDASEHPEMGKGKSNWEDKILKVNIPHKVIELPLTEIVTVLANNHAVELKLITGEVKQNIMLFGELESALENEPNFLLCSRGIIINMDYASLIKDDKIFLSAPLIIWFLYHILWWLSKKMTERAELQRSLDLFQMEENQYRKTRRYLQESSQLRHDFRQHILIINDYLKQGQTDKLDEYLAPLVEHISQRHKAICENQAVDAEHRKPL